MQSEFPTDIDLYQRKHIGVYGEFGAGANARVRFIQTAMQPEALLTVSLVSSIPGSEKWDIVDLFQRNVDTERVTNSILPYLEDPTRIKFFNPLTLVVLPLDESGRSVYRRLPHLEPRAEGNYNYLENEPYFRLKLSSDESFGTLEWNSDRCRLVAIDGQHRLSAVQRLYKKPDPQVDIRNWKVPVVLLVIEREDPEADSASLLDLIRNTFVYINKQAVTINPSREILLNDESPNAICTQEFVRYCHQNDVKPLDEREQTRIPLLLIDWRGDTSNKRRVYSPAALKTVEEIYLWHETYILGEDYSNSQRIELGIDDAMPPLKGFRHDQTLSSSEASRVREFYRDTVLSGVMGFLEEFEPYKNYIAALREMEIENARESDIKQHAFMQLRFGTHDAPDEQKDEVWDMYRELVDDITAQKGMLPDLIERDIGMRGVVYALGRLKRVAVEDHLSQNQGRPTWASFCSSVVGYFNEMYAEHWFDDVKDPEFAGDQEIADFLYLVAFESNGNIANYRISDMEGGLGSLIAVVVASKMRRDEFVSESTLKDFWEEQQIVLGKTIHKEARKMHKAVLKASFEGTLDQFNAEVKRRAEATSREKIERIGRYIGVD